MLLDLNLLIALAWPAHEHHTAARNWFLAQKTWKWATCPITQLGFVRLLSNPAFSPDALKVAEALELLAKNVSQPSHEFWPDSLSVPRALKLLTGPTAGYRQLTDGYLLALAVRRKGRLATFDGGLLEFAKQAGLDSHVELIARG